MRTEVDFILSGSGANFARVVSVGRNAVRVVRDGEAELRVASLPKRLERLHLVPGDRVRIAPLDDARFVVDAREPRVSEVVRPTAGGRTKTMAANVDTLAIAAAFSRPPLQRTMIDELLAFARIQPLAAVLVLSKPDLVEPAEIAEVVTLYASVAEAVFVTNGHTGEGTEAIAEALASRRTLLLGPSGVGKSTLFRHLGGVNEVGDVSRSGRGRQTTSSGRLHGFATTGGFVVDSPGVGEFALDEIDAPLLAAGFVEFTPYLGACRFADCRHLVEPGCAIEAAVTAGAIAASRLASYRSILARRGAS